MMDQKRREQMEAIRKNNLERKQKLAEEREEKNRIRARKEQQEIEQKVFLEKERIRKEKWAAYERAKKFHKDQKASN